MLFPPPLPKITNSKRPHPAAGFTLLEIMLVVAIIAVLIATAVELMGPNLDYANEMAARGAIQSIGTQLKMYEAATGSLPTTEQGLQALVNEPTTDPKPANWHRFLEELPKDPWNQDYVYVYPGKHNPNGYDLYSKGKDHLPDTNDDIGNWKKDQ